MVIFIIIRNAIKHVQMDILEILLINNVVNANKIVEFVKMLIIVLIVIIIILIMDNKIIFC